MVLTEWSKEKEGEPCRLATLLFPPPGDMMGIDVGIDPSDYGTYMRMPKSQVLTTKLFSPDDALNGFCAYK